jgi:hypothetical protein
MENFAQLVAEDDELTATCALCPNEDCGSLVIIVSNGRHTQFRRVGFCVLAVWACVLGAGGRTGLSVHSTGDALRKAAAHSTCLNGELQVPDTLHGILTMFGCVRPLRSSGRWIVRYFLPHVL